MLVEINLIEKKKRKNLFLIIMGSVLFLCLLFCVLLFLFYQSLYHQDSKIQSQLIYEEQLRSTKVNNINSDKTVQALKKFKNALQWAENYPISTSILLKNITSLLPEKGYIVSFNLTADDVLLLDVRFDTSKEAAYYLKYLEDANFVKEVNLDNITTLELQNEKGYLPRYTAQYTIQLNKDNLKKTGSGE
jgi:type IV pilus assembly protein PilN